MTFKESQGISSGHGARLRWDNTSILHEFGCAKSTHDLEGLVVDDAIARFLQCISPTSLFGPTIVHNLSKQRFSPPTKQDGVWTNQSPPMLRSFLPFLTRRYHQMENGRPFQEINRKSTPGALALALEVNFPLGCHLLAVLRTTALVGYMRAKHC